MLKVIGPAFQATVFDDIGPVLLFMASSPYESLGISDTLPILPTLPFLSCCSLYPGLDVGLLRMMPSTPGPFALTPPGVSGSQAHIWQGHLVHWGQRREPTRDERLYCKQAVQLSVNSYPCLRNREQLCGPGAHS